VTPPDNAQPSQADFWEVLDGSTGVLSARSAVLLDKLATFCQLPTKGRLMDVGCGKGHWLSEFQTRFPGWRLNGDDLLETNRPWVEAIPGVEAFYSGPDPSSYDGGFVFDVISLSHVLEHIAASLGRDDEEPNVALAQEIADAGDEAAVKDLVGLLSHQDKDVQSDSIKVLYEIAELRPSLVEAHCDILARLLASENNTLTLLRCHDGNASTL